MSIFHQVTRLAMAIGWTVATIVLGAVALRLHRGGKVFRFRERFRSVLLEEWIGAGFLGLMLLAELWMAVAALPNSPDGLTYHLARIEHWRVNQSVGPYPAAIDRQVLLAPGGEYLMLTLRLLSDSVRFAPLVSWFSAAGSLIVVHRIAGQLGCGRRGQLAAAVLAGTVPLAVMQASSSLTDLTVAFFLLCLASLLLEFRERPGWWLAVLVGLALGESILTKSTAMPLAVGFGFWWAYLLLRRGWKGIAFGVFGAIAMTVVVAPYVLMLTTVWGSPLGSEALAASTTVTQHDPVTIAMNTAKIGSGGLVSSDPSETAIICQAVRGIHKVAGRDISDPATTFRGWPFLCRYDKAELAGSSPWHGPVIGACVLATIAMGTRKQRSYAIAVGVGAVVFVGTVAYQYWVTRLWLGGLLVGVPLLPVVFARVRTKLPKLASLRMVVVGAILMVAVLSGVSALAGGWPRPLVGSGLLPPSSAAKQLVGDHPEIAAATAQVAAAGGRQIGLVEQEDTQEFAIWVLTGATENRASIVILNSQIPGYQSPRQPVDAIICIPDRTPTDCRPYIPPGWPTTFHAGNRGAVVALPPPRR